MISCENYISFKRLWMHKTTCNNNYLLYYIDIIRFRNFRVNFDLNPDQVLHLRYIL